MSEDDVQPEDDESQPPKVLDYRRSGETPPPPNNRTSLGVQAGLGVVSFVAAGFLSLAALGTLPAPKMRTSADYLLPIGFITAIYGAIFWFGIHSWARWGWRGYAAGFWGSAGLLFLGISCICGR